MESNDLSHLITHEGTVVERAGRFHERLGIITDEDGEYDNYMAGVLADARTIISSKAGKDNYVVNSVGQRYNLRRGDTYKGESQYYRL